MHELVYLNSRHNQNELEGGKGVYGAVLFPSCVGAVASMKIHCNNCPFVLQGQ